MEVSLVGDAVLPKICGVMIFHYLLMVVSLSGTRLCRSQWGV